MALTVTKKLPNGQPDAIGGFTWFAVAAVTFDNSYATGGESLTAADLGFQPNVTIVQLTAHPASGFHFEYDYTNKKLKAFTPLRKFTSAAFDAASLAAVTARDEALTVTGVAATDEVVAGRGPDALEAKYLIKGARATGADTVTARADNHSAAAVDPVSGTFTFYVAKANMAGVEVASAVDLSAVTTRVVAFGAVI